MDSQVVSALIGVAGALMGAYGGAFLTNRHAVNNWSTQQVSEREKEERVVLRAKVEECYFLLNKWRNEVIIIAKSRLLFFRGGITHGELLKYIQDSVDPHTYSKIDVLLSLYFDDLRGDLDNVKNIIGSMQLTYDAQRMGCMDVDVACRNHNDDYGEFLDCMDAIIEKIIAKIPKYPS
ncbi:hypothetical protein [Citrobacter europaeus]|uniref:hypothetical protein n=1 Tax=Citrobacter europaeus TaxID=1914243 RepID=UPI0039C3FB29